ncbi:MAG: pyruvate formate lyase family protein [Promethearchaeota archaeon]
MNENTRIPRLRERYQTEIPIISIERAKLFTKKWYELENSDLSQGERVAMSMKHVFENMTHYVDQDDRIAGYWTENFIGFPIDIERGVFNTVFETEINKRSLLSFRLKSILKTGGYLIKKKQLRSFFHNMKITKSMGAQPINFSLDTMDKREINPYIINEKDKKLLLKKILPKWKGKSFVDILEKEVYASDLLDKNMVEFLKSFPANTSRQTMMTSMCSTIATYQGHIIMDFEKVLKTGTSGIRKKVEQQLSNNEIKKEDKDFLHSVEIALDGIEIYAKRLAEALMEYYNAEIDEIRKAELFKMYKNCEKLPLNPAETFYEAVQSAWIIKVATELVHPVNLHCFGRMDQIFYPYYKKDLEKGIINPQDAKELLAELLLKVMALNIRAESNTIGNFYHRYLGSTPITIGGLKPNGKDGTNDLTYLFLEAAELSRAVTNISLRVHSGTPDKLLYAAAEVLYKGCSNISLFNDDICVDAMKMRGYEEEDARDYAIMGCVEMIGPGKTGGMSANAILLCRLLDITLRNGNAQTLIGLMKGDGIKTGNPEDFSSFEDLIEALITQGKHQVKLIMDISNLRDELFSKYLPAPFISAFIEGCIENRRDVTTGGAKYDLSGISFINSIANLTDSLYTIKKLIYDEKITTYSELMKAIDNNYVGYEDLHKKILKLPGKWGNGYKKVDEIAKTVSTRLFKETYKHKTYRGGVFVPYVISMTTHTIDGRISIATPDGRRAATPYAASCNPYNVEKNGITGVLRSVASLDNKHILGCAVNIKFHPSAVGKTEIIREKWAALIRTYFKLGGIQMQPTVVSVGMLKAAQECPNDYRDVIVKVGGYSAYFTELGIEIQNEVIARTEHNAI